MIISYAHAQGKVINKLIVQKENCALNPFVNRAFVIKIVNTACILRIVDVK